MCTPATQARAKRRSAACSPIAPRGEAAVWCGPILPRKRAASAPIALTGDDPGDEEDSLSNAFRTLGLPEDATCAKIARGQSPDHSIG